MKDGIQRIRVFAGPNGSGKSSLVRMLAKEFSSDGKFFIRHWINADEMEAALRLGGLKLDAVASNMDGEALLHFLATSHRLPSTHPFLTHAQCIDGMLTTTQESIDSYVAATIADFFRRKLAVRGESFSFESVLSHPSKIEELANAKRQGARIYLYFIATESPDLNEQRILRRVLLGEHSVSRAKIVERYYRSLALLPEAINVADRAYLFDNSGNAPIWFAEKLPSGQIENRAADGWMPSWFLRRSP